MPHPEVLGLDRSRLARSADAHGGYARALETRERTDLLPWIAGSRLLAAVYRCLVNPEVARTELRDATYAYLQLGSPYAAVLAVCAGDTGLLEQSYAAVAAGDLRKAGAIERVATVLAVEWLGRPLPEFKLGWEKDAERLVFRLGRAPSGRTGTPILLYTEAFAEAQHPPAGGVPPRAVGAQRHRSLPALAALLERAAEPVFGAMGDRHHWVRLYSATLPVEPEVVGACRCVLRAWMRGGRTVGELHERIAGEVHPIVLLPLEVAIDLEEPGPEQESSGNPSAVIAPGPAASGPPRGKRGRDARAWDDEDRDHEEDEDRQDEDEEAWENGDWDEEFKEDEEYKGDQEPKPA